MRTYLPRLCPRALERIGRASFLPGSLPPGNKHVCVRELVSLAALWGSVQRGDDMHVCAVAGRKGVGGFKGLQGGGGREGWDCLVTCPICRIGILIMAF